MVATQEITLQCAPGIDGSGGSCMSLGILLVLANKYNEVNPNNPILIPSKSKQMTNSVKAKELLVNQMEEKFKDVCTDQKCWIKQNFMDGINESITIELERYTWKPVGPQGQFTWLNTLNINDNMEQHEKVSPDFKWFGAVPMDFAKLDRLEISRPNWNELYDNGKRKIGIIFNLDPSYRPGSHWVAMFSDLNKGHIYFCDSYGIEPPKPVQVLMTSIKKFLETKMNSDDIIMDYNRNRFQYGGSECGVYSMSFILRMLNGDSFETICKDKITDTQVNLCRLLYFNGVTFDISGAEDLLDPSICGL